jgi:UDP-galactopyranose mutase
MEEPILGATHNHLEVNQATDLNLWIAVPHLVHGMEEQDINEAQRSFVSELVDSFSIKDPITWYYSPMALSFTDHLQPHLVVYDCMDELSAFDNAPVALTKMENELLELADIVFTGGHNLYQAKKTLHSNIFPIPSSIDKDHFSRARLSQADPADQAGIPHPRIGFYGVVDERLNIQLVNDIATQRPDWHLVIIGPVVKIDPATLPKRDNIHYLGGKNYTELPAYLAGWDVAMMPFALNRSTKYISPTKTPEYLAGGKPVVSTSITDVVDPYGKEGLVHIADTATEFVVAIEKALVQEDKKIWLQKVDAFLSGISWDKTFQTMSDLMGLTSTSKKITDTKKTKEYV